MLEKIYILNIFFHFNFLFIKGCKKVYWFAQKYEAQLF